MERLHYPNTRKVEQIDDYHGTRVSDPYRWLEDTSSPVVKSWIDEQNLLTQSFLNDIPAKDRIRKRLTALWNYPRAFAPQKVRGSYFQLRNSGLQNQDVLYVMDSLEGEKRTLLDPNELSTDGTVALTNWEVSKDGNWLAYATNNSGSDWQFWRVRDVKTGTDLPDKIEWSKFSNVAWHPDNSGFFYCGYDQPEENETYEGLNLNQKVLFHRLGTDQAEDQLVYQRLDQPEWGYDPIVSEDGKYLILHISQGTDTRNRLFYRELDFEGEFTEQISDLEANYQFLGNDGSLFFLQTNYRAPRGRLISIDTQNPHKPSWKTIIPENNDAIENAKIVNEQFIVIYLHDAYHLISRFGLDGDYLGEIALPMIGSIFSLDHELYLFGDRFNDELYFTFNSFTLPPTVLRYSFFDDRCIEIDKPALDFDFSSYQTEQVFVTSKDGTQVPMFIIGSKDILKNKKNPTLLYGYGGFNISLSPNFLVSRLVWLELGGLLAVANLRGGGEGGEEWHQAGSLLNKQNVFDDMIACAEYLISENYTSSDKLVIEGRSNGGLLVGACITQRPDLFGAALPAVGVMDMLRFHQFTIGWAWVSDYGSAQDPEQFKVLYAYSPLHNIEKGISYPATLATTADHDDRVVPGHSFKFIAALQCAQAGDAPVLIRVQTKAGHGFGKPTKLLIEEQTDIFAFLVKVLDIRVH
jgi:prolyl oligopeptidase